MRNMLKVLKKTRDAIVVFVQKVLVTVSLVCIYFLGFGIIFLFCLIFKRRELYGTLSDNVTFWTPADDSDDAAEDAARQS